MKIPLLSLPAALGLLCLANFQKTHAQKLWNINDGLWSDDQAWTPENAPVEESVVFAIYGGSPNASIDVSINDAVTIDQLFVDFGKTVHLNFESGASLSTDSGLWQLNTKRANSGTAAAPAHLHFNGPASGTATVTIYGLQVGVGGAAAGGSSITFNGPGLVVTNAPTGNATVVGRASADNTLTVKNKADVTLHGLWVGQSTVANLGHQRNAAIVDNASLTLNGGSGNNGLYIGSVRSGAGGTDYNNGMQSNSLHIQNKGKVTLATGHTGTAPGSLRIGAVANAHSNSLIIDSGGELSVTAENAITIGDAAANNLGGNSLTLQDGTLRTNGTILISDFNASGQNAGQNRMTVGSGGELYSSSSITVRGHLQLDEEGKIDGRALNDDDSSLDLVIESNGFFEAQGDGLGQNVTTTVKGGALSVGTLATAANLTIHSELTFTDHPGTLAMSLFENGVSDTLHLTQEGALTLNNTLLMLTLENFTPVYGDQWTLFWGRNRTHQWSL